MRSRVSRDEIDHVKRALDDLVQCLRSSGAPSLSEGIGWELPPDLQAAGADAPVSLYLGRAEFDLLEKARRALSNDLRFEYLKDRQIQDLTWRLAYEASVGDVDVVTSFIEANGREVGSHTCYFRVDLLEVTSRIETHGVTLIPAGELAGHDQPGLANATGCVAAVPASGTDFGRMVQRARGPAEHALRVLRATLREYRFMPDEQLRFTIGHDYWFDSGVTGWTAEPGQGWSLELDEKVLRAARAAPLFDLGPDPSNEVEKRTLLALTWFEQAQLSTDPILELLFLFSALEAILGNKAEGLKGHHLALRRAMLGLLTRDGFSHPSRTFFLYDQVRSAAVHGEEAPDVSERDVKTFAADVRRAMNEYLEFSRREKLVKRKRIRQHLDTHERRARVLAGLVRDDPGNWKRFAEDEAAAQAK